MLLRDGRNTGATQVEPPDQNRPVPPTKRPPPKKNKKTKKKAKKPRRDEPDVNDDDNQDIEEPDVEEPDAERPDVEEPGAERPDPNNGKKQKDKQSKKKKKKKPLQAQAEVDNNEEESESEDGSDDSIELLGISRKVVNPAAGSAVTFSTSNYADNRKIVTVAQDDKLGSETKNYSAWKTILEGIFEYNGCMDIVDGT